MIVLDKDKDGELSAQEIAAAAEALATLDKNEDGIVSHDELRPPPPPPPGELDLVEHLLTHDTDGDGVLTPVEMLPPHARMLFDEADTNEDGVIDAAELEAWAETLPSPPEE
jgi:Ca2+-binding EF-hand superfamily protein